jgi:hypothetical protein
MKRRLRDRVGDLRKLEGLAWCVGTGKRKGLIGVRGMCSKMRESMVCKATNLGSIRSIDPPPRCQPIMKERKTHAAQRPASRLCHVSHIVGSSHATAKISSTVVAALHPLNNGLAGCLESNQHHVLQHAIPVKLHW